MLDIPLNAEARDRGGRGHDLRPGAGRGHPTAHGEEFAELLETEGAGFGVELSLAGLQAMLDVPASHLEPGPAAVRRGCHRAGPGRRGTSTGTSSCGWPRSSRPRPTRPRSASIAFRSAVFDAETRASRMNGGEPETVSQVTGEAVRGFNADHFGPAGAVMIMAGDFQQDPQALAERCLGSWQNPSQARSSRQAPAPGPRRTVLIDRPGAVQADVRLGGFGIDRLDPRWSDISVASYAMGGAFLSRLNAVLREDKGYTYGVRMNFGPLRNGGSFAVQGSFRTEVVVDALSLTRDLIDVADAPITTARSTRRSPSSPASPRSGTPPPTASPTRPPPRSWPTSATTTSTAASRCCARSPRSQPPLPTSPSCIGPAHPGGGG